MFPSPFFLLFTVFFFIKSNAAYEDVTVLFGENHCHPPSPCKKGVEIKYPFWRLDDSSSTVCGYPGFGIDCSNPDPDFPLLYLSDDSFLVKEINYDAFSVTLADADAYNKECPRARHNFTLTQKSPLLYVHKDLNLTFYFNCTKNPLPAAAGGAAYPIDCLNKSDRKASYLYVGALNPYNWDWLGICEAKVETTVMETAGVVENDIEWLVKNIGGAMSNGFMLHWQPLDDCGHCDIPEGWCEQDNHYFRKFLCFCENGNVIRDCPSKGFGFECYEDGVEKFGFFEDDNSDPSGVLDPYEESYCESKVEVPISEIRLAEVRGNKTELLTALSQGILVVYNGSYEYCFACEKSNGICWSGTSLEEPTCLCHDGIYPYLCGFDDKGNKKTGLKIGLAIGGVAFGFLLGFFCLFAYRRQKKRSVSSSYLMSRSVPSNPSSSTIDLEGGSNYHGVPLFDYTELEEATNSFDARNELGDGGFGTVYKGKLRDGRVVAVKRLYENNYKRVEQFMNEIEILARMRHKNLVTLYGCTSRNSRELLLVYEYVPNGTIADHLHGERARPGLMCWATRLSIAVETASALAYLHLSDVIHRDVKTNNILLDNNFCVKVADFGLSRLFPIDVTHVSTAPQGTPGYVDPEYHECYQLTSKSDVYSFGVVLVELISSLPAVDITRHRHEINLSNMAINKIQCNALHELVDKSLGFESDVKIREMISAVAELAFQCLQSGKDMRPSMPEVLESLLEIQNMDSNGKTDSHSKRSPTDSSLLLKNIEPAALSPNSVITAQWPSRSTTNNSSSSC
ncbi:LEAF RUST 10 DISEASE-RESISTANCE LOCUS RECEPTOR-LIKE PROTEIN KINASE-like 1.2 isoform X1 [Ipomoea triloba]|uniref:LEAF RUST 10 DISEASE-RESISTANCE LOCUS RECEPTOR-LIKE PROTEIN KINASE-like 1.2 isoform X1 n=1 Tax=Ipomoea triloba TaxID=35885 RepID=UPI00125E117C|nr:LEAF RUST 10 DISEASE-RESISTANCE LOCUS RECEPTOR-LIKE PROTEIN KINASE-like 1.2 isoform X1 [Ipomoea triloba]